MIIAHLAKEMRQRQDFRLARSSSVSKAEKGKEAKEKEKEKGGRKAKSRPLAPQYFGVNPQRLV